MKIPKRAKLSDITPEMMKRNVSKTHSQTIFPCNISELEEVMIDKETGYIKSISIEALMGAGITMDQIRWFMHVHGLYTFPTTELIDWLKSIIDPDSCIEICAGTGWIGRELDIISTDSQSQADSEVATTYLSNGVIPIIYPDDVEKLTAVEAIKKYRPKYVIGSYVTAKYGTSGANYGSIFGVNTKWVSNNCGMFIMIGNENIHSKDSIMKTPHKTYEFPWLITRGDTSKARIYVWERKNWK